MRKKTHSIALVIFLGMACLCFGSSQQAPAPVPPDVSISAPDPSLPEQVKSLLGKWVGQWDSPYGWDSALYIEKIDGDSAQVVFACGEYNTFRKSCHCNPNWVRVQKGKVKYSDSSVTLDFYTPALLPVWVKMSHTVSGSSEERYGMRWAGPHRQSTGLFTYSFVVDKSDPGTMKGDFLTGMGSPLHVKMKKVEQGKESDR